MFKILSKIRNVLSNSNYRQIAKFIFVGCINTAIYYGIYIIMIRRGFFFATAITVGTIAGVINSYFWNKFFTFRSHRKSIAEIVKFITVYVVQYVSNIAIVHVCITHFNISEALSGLIAVFVGVFISFLGHRFWSFKV